jgi:poly-gamma-glutamate capsule biosynthesis protein CapA/YwtB (metallophosphatase superfamily)
VPVEILLMRVGRPSSRLILDGCGDLIDDYEGIAGHGRYRSDLGVMCFPTLEVATGRLAGLAMVPMQMRRLQLCHVDSDGVNWLRDTLSRISRGFGCSVESQEPSVPSLRW